MGIVETLKVELFVKYSSNLVKYQRYVMNKFGWWRVANPKYPRNQSVSKFFQICLNKGIIEHIGNNMYSLPKNYKALIVEVIDSYNDGKFMDQISEFYDIYDAD